MASDGAVLIRPDGLIAWRASSRRPADALRRVLAGPAPRNSAPTGPASAAGGAHQSAQRPAHEELGRRAYQ
ncbi:aromatic-ring hydroxylase C-terminal domain-containing protein [Nonomuraea dietziae]|uniref:aromatic-ring hydroxylase C-terminal domain-containing protein n=1 Tax=Nonomuraea dietziae TaxID=65515 RepID=UPI00332620CA